MQVTPSCSASGVGYSWNGMEETSLQLYQKVWPNAHLTRCYLWEGCNPNEAANAGSCRQQRWPLSLVRQELLTTLLLWSGRFVLAPASLLDWTGIRDWLSRHAARSA